MLWMQNSSWNQCYSRSNRVHRFIYRPSHNWLLVVVQHLFFSLPSPFSSLSSFFCTILRYQELQILHFCFVSIHCDAVFIISFTSLKCVWIACHFCTTFFFSFLLLPSKSQILVRNQTKNASSKFVNTMTTPSTSSCVQKAQSFMLKVSNKFLFNDEYIFRRRKPIETIDVEWLMWQKVSVLLNWLRGKLGKGTSSMNWVVIYKYKLVLIRQNARFFVTHKKEKVLSMLKHEQLLQSKIETNRMCCEVWSKHIHNSETCQYTFMLLIFMLK